MDCGGRTAQRDRRLHHRHPARARGPHAPPPATTRSSTTSAPTATTTTGACTPGATSPTARPPPGPPATPFAGRDAYGAFAYVKLKPGASNVGFLVVDKDGTKDVAADRTIDVTKTGEVWIKQGKDAVLTRQPAADYPAQDRTKAVLHYHRADGDYDGWGLHAWTGAANPTDWSKPLEPVRTDAYGAVFEVPLADGATEPELHHPQGRQKDLPDRPVPRSSNT